MSEERPEYRVAPEFLRRAADTVDELVIARRESKREVQDLLLEAMKRKQR